MLELSASPIGLAPVPLATPRRAPARPSEVRVEISDRLVEEALEHLWDYSYLGSHPLVSARLARSYLANGKGRETHIDRGMAVSRLLQDAIQKLKALQPRKPSSEARLYDILYGAYVEGEKNPDVARRLGSSQRTFY